MGSNGNLWVQVRIFGVFGGLKTGCCVKSG
jgi:hypothetical protein